MVTSLIETVGTGLHNYVFGSWIYGGLVILAIFAYIGLRNNWPKEVYLVFGLPLMFVMTELETKFFSQNIFLVFLLGAGIVLGLGVKHFILDR